MLVCSGDVVFFTGCPRRRVFVSEGLVLVGPVWETRHEVRQANYEICVSRKQSTVVCYCCYCCYN